MASSEEEEDHHPSSGARIGPWQVRMIILLVAALILVVSIFLTAPRERLGVFGDIVKDVGVVVLGLVVIDIVWQLVGGDPVQNSLVALGDRMRTSVGKMLRLSEFTRKADPLGVIAIACDEDALPLKLPRLIENASQSVDISGWCLLMIMEHSEVQRALERALKRGVVVRILMSDPDAAWLQAMNKPNNLEGVRTTARQMLTPLKSLARQGALVRQLRDRAMTVSMLRFDEFMQVMPYLVSETSAHSPRFHVQKAESHLFRAWQREFEYTFGVGEDVRSD